MQKHPRSIQKNKRYSQTKQHNHNPQPKHSPYQVQPSQYPSEQYKNNQAKQQYSKIHSYNNYLNVNVHGHNRSQSIGAKKTGYADRFRTQYGDNRPIQYIDDQEEQTGYQRNERNRDVIKSKDKSKGRDRQAQYSRSNKDKQRASFDKYYKKTTYYNSKKRNDTQPFPTQKHNSMITDQAIHSTKSNARKNLQLRILFNKTKHGQQNSQHHSQHNTSTHKSKPSTYTVNHPLLKYVNNNVGNKNNHIKSPYTTQIQRFQSLYAKMKNSTSKNKNKNTNNNKRNNSISREKDKAQVFINLSKNQIKLGNIVGTGVPTAKQKRQDQQETVKTIKKVNKDNGPNTSKSNDIQRDDEKSREKDRQRQRQRDKERERERDRELNQESVNSSQEDGYGLTEEEEQTFGNRFPFGFQKLKLLGRGGFSLVWLGRHQKSHKQFAIKQIKTQNTHQTHIKQIWFGTTFFNLGGVPRPQFIKYPGIKNLVKMYSYQINQNDTWIYYQKCGNSLGSNLYDIRAQRVYGEQRLYKIYYKEFYKALADDIGLLKQLIVEICKPLVVLSACEIVHSDLKTQNILIKYQQSSSTYTLTQTKLIDYGSSFQFKNISQFSMATPEYMPPQILNYIIHQNQGEYEPALYQEVMNNYKNPWIIDMFSLGCVLLEIIVGVPLWMSLPLLVPSKAGMSFCQKEGLFAVKGRVFGEIIQKQRKVISRLDQVLDNQNYSKIVLSPALRTVIKGMLAIDFNTRISPTQVIEILQKQKL